MSEPTLPEEPQPELTVQERLRAEVERYAMQVRNQLGAPEAITQFDAVLERFDHGVKQCLLAKDLPQERITQIHEITGASFNRVGRDIDRVIRENGGDPVISVRAPDRIEDLAYNATTPRTVGELFASIHKEMIGYKPTQYRAAR